MKTLLLWRHAKASSGDPRQDDTDRKLAERGVEAAAAMAGSRRDPLARASLILCSPAERTRQTLAALEPALAEGTTRRFEAGLYLTPCLDLLERVARVEEDHEIVLLIGHNPGLEDLARLLVVEGDDEAITRLGSGFKTGALAELHLDVEHWREVGAGCARLDRFTRPRDLQDAAEPT